MACRSTLFVALALALALAGCSTGSLVEVESARISADAVALDFGEVLLLSSETRSLVVRNFGGSELVIAPRIDEAGAFSIVFAETRLPAGTSVTFSLGFSPLEEGAQSAILVLENDSTNRPHLVVALFGRGTSPQVSCGACDTPPATGCYRPLGECVNGECVYAQFGGSCDDSNSCTLDDVCYDGVCSGTALLCNAPPSDGCADATTVRRHGAGGHCVAGGCVYDFVDEPCAPGVLCSDGACQPGGPVAQVSAGTLSTCARLQGGEVYCFGYNDLGGLGDGTRTDSATPVQVLGVGGTIDVEAGLYHACAVLSSGAVKCWGHNAVGQLGNDETGESAGVPIAVDVFGLTDAAQVTVAQYFTCARHTSGAVSCWGAHYDPVPTEVVLPGPAEWISTGMNHSCAVLTGGAVWCWGENYHGQLGDGSTDPSWEPVPVVGLTDAVQVSAGNMYSCAVDASGGVACWGKNENYELGLGVSAQSVPTFVPVPGLDDVVYIAASEGLHTCALRINGDVVCWGNGAAGQLGDGGQSGATTVPSTPTLTDATSLSAGVFHTCAVVTGRAFCWGSGSNGQLGNGVVGQISLTPLEVTAL